MWCTSLTKIRVGDLPDIAMELGFTQNPIPYASVGQYSAKAGAKLQQPDMSEFDALRQLVSKPLLKVFRARAEAYFAANNLHAEYDADGVWRYWAAVIAHGIVQYSTEDDAYVADKSSVDGMLGNGLLRKLHSRAQWQRAKQAWTAPRDALTDHFNSRARELWVPTQCDFTNNFHNNAYHDLSFYYLTFAQTASSRRGWNTNVRQYLGAEIYTGQAASKCC